MAISISDEPRLDQRVRVSASGVVELVFALYRCTFLRPKHGDGGQARILGSRPGLIEKIEGFWPDAPGDFTEALVLAHEAETLLLEDAEPFLAALEDVAGRAFVIPPFPTESPEAAETIRSHLLQLRASPARRRAYAALLEEVWEALKPPLQAARQESARIVTELRSALREASTIEEVLPAKLLQWCDLTAPLIAPAAERGELVIVPMALADTGRLFFGLPGLLLVAFSVDKIRRPGMVDRAAAEKVAVRYKVLADPSRLQLLGSLLRDESTISELADLYGLSQPTVSVHVKQLREAGLLNSERHGAQTFYRADPERVRDLLGDDVGALTGS